MASEYEDFLNELFAPIDGVSFRRMFGGLGIFKEKTMFGLVSDDVLYFRTDDQTVPDFEAEGCGPFIYESKGKSGQMPYWRAPEHLFDDAEAFADWARKSFDAALRVAKAKSRR